MKSSCQQQKGAGSLAPIPAAASAPQAYAGAAAGRRSCWCHRAASPQNLRLWETRVKENSIFPLVLIQSLFSADCMRLGETCSLLGTKHAEMVMQGPGTSSCCRWFRSNEKQGKELLIQNPCRSIRSLCHDCMVLSTSVGLEATALLWLRWL